MNHFRRKCRPRDRETLRRRLLNAYCVDCGSPTTLSRWRRYSTGFCRSCLQKLGGYWGLLKKTRQARDARLERQRNAIRTTFGD